MKKGTATPAKNIIDAATKARNFKTFLSAVEAAGLTATLTNKTNTFTVLAPTDEAFGAVDNDALKDLLKPANKKALERVLKHHVIRGRMDAKNVGMRTSLRPLDGGELKVTKENGDVFIGAARVVKTDVKTENGIIHVIDTVLMPEEKAA